MNIYRADLHIHTVLSPCASLDMSPARIVARAQEERLDLIAITDHNSTLQGPMVRRMADPLGIKVLLGAEVTSREEVHCLCLFDTEPQRAAFQSYLDLCLPRTPNDTRRLGFQVLVNERDEIVGEVEHALFAATTASVNDLEREVHALGGIFIPAHVDRGMFSLTSQLGFIPPELGYDALEITQQVDPSRFLADHPYLANRALVRCSDAHQPGRIGHSTTRFRMIEPSLSEILKCLRAQAQREVIL